MTEVLDHGYVKFIESWGSDEIIIESARMSTNKGFQGWGKEKCVYCGGSGYHEGITKGKCLDCNGEPYKPGDEKLLKFLYEHKHMTPFEMCGMTIEVQAPIFVLREWHRHRTQSYNEMSARYTELPKLAYIPSIERLNLPRNQKNKQESGYSVWNPEYAPRIQQFIFDEYNHAYEKYQAMLALGVAREVARTVLPVGMYSRMRASANLRCWLMFLTLRQDPAAQYEIRMYANVVAQLIAEKFPRTYELFT